MKKRFIYELNAFYREPMCIIGYEFGVGEHTVCVVGSMRGNENQQLFTCSQLIQRLKQLEEQAALTEGKSILVIPCLNSYSINIGKRFGSTDNTDINRMFPGYAEGETTQRIAAGVFERIKDYQYGIQLASNYMEGDFLPHIRMMRTGFEDVETAKGFAFPYIVTRNPHPYDTTTLNYNWQIWGTKAFSVYTTTTETIDRESADKAVKGIERMLNREKILNSEVLGGDNAHTQVISDENLLSVRCKEAGFYKSGVSVGEEVHKGQILAVITDPYEGFIKEELVSDSDGIVFFQHKSPLIYAGTAVIKLVRYDSDYKRLSNSGTIGWQIASTTFPVNGLDK